MGAGSRRTGADSRWRGNRSHLLKQAKNLAWNRYVPPVARHILGVLGNSRESALEDIDVVAYDDKFPAFFASFVKFLKSAWNINHPVDDPHIFPARAASLIVLRVNDTGENYSD
jgi:hypothetical protein